MNEKEKNNQLPFRLQRHDPIDSISSDLLGFDKLVPRFIKLLEVTDPPYVIGITGEWGLGKSSFLECVRQEMVGSEHFEPIERIELWKFSGRVDLATAVVAKLAQHFELEATTWKKIKKTLFTLGRATSFGIAGVNVKFSAIEDIYKAWKGADNELNQQFDDLIDKGLEKEGGRDRVVVVFIDDLDRCLPDEALDLLQKLRIFFNSRKVIFVIALDESVVSAAIQAHFGKDSGIDGHWYLEKLIDRFYELPTPTQEQLERLVLNRFGEIEGRFGFIDKAAQAIKRMIKLHWIATHPYSQQTRKVPIWNPRRIVKAIDQMFVSWQGTTEQGAKAASLCLLSLFLMKDAYPEVYEVARTNPEALIDIALVGGRIDNIQDLRGRDKNLAENVSRKYGKPVESICENTEAIEMCRRVLYTIDEFSRSIFQGGANYARPMIDRLRDYIRRLEHFQ